MPRPETMQRHFVRCLESSRKSCCAVKTSPNSFNKPKMSIFADGKQKKMSTRQLEIEGLIRHLGMEILPQGAHLSLFGSQARDEARPDSDWDLLILLDGDKVSNEDFDRWVFPFISLGWSLGIEINPVVYTFGEWQQRKITPFYKNVMKERVVLC